MKLWKKIGRMGGSNCSFCGRPVGLIRRAHPECEAKYVRALASIPGFMEKAIYSAVPSRRFSELLLDAAAACYLNAGELERACAEGFEASINSILHTRILSNAEFERALDIVESLRSVLGVRLESVRELIAKIGIVKALLNGKASSLISVRGPMPLDLASDEEVIWIFNQAIAFGPVPVDEDPLMPRHNNFKYISPAAIQTRPFPHSTTGGEKTGDLIITDRNVFFMSDESSKIRLRLSAAVTVNAYDRGIQIVYDTRGIRKRLFVVDDPWLASNVIAALIGTESKAKTIPQL